MCVGVVVACKGCQNIVNVSELEGMNENNEKEVGTGDDEVGSLQIKIPGTKAPSNYCPLPYQSNW